VGALAKTAGLGRHGFTHFLLELVRRSGPWRKGRMSRRAPTSYLRRGRDRVKTVSWDGNQKPRGEPMLKEFKEFVSRGSVIDLAVGIIIGVAFTAIVNSLVNDIIMPPIGLLLGGIDFSNFFITLKGTSQATLKATQDSGAVVIAYGQFINSVIKFLIVAFAVFLLIKQVNRFVPKKEAAPAAPWLGRPSRLAFADDAVTDPFLGQPNCLSL
jgi:large conductance mechanosensitive channel